MTEKIPVVHSKSVGRRQAVLEGRDPAVQMITRTELDRLRECAESGYDLSLWAASINWDGTPNGKLWLRDLQRHIERVQELWPGPRRGLHVERRQP